MHEQFSRRGFLGAAAAVGATVGTTGFALRSRAMTLAPEDTLGDGLGSAYPTTEPQLAQAMVGASHVNAARVEELLRQDPSLALATWDWGFGDWETALGAASHMGNREIAGLLMAHGARPDLFTLAMLDHVDAVRAVCQAVPGAQQKLGPHGISLLTHAQHGNAARVQEYLTTLGNADGAEPGEAIDDETLDIFAGSYASDGERLVVSRHRQGWLGINREGGTFRTLRRKGDREFSPAGAPHVQVVFTGSDDHITGLNIRHGERRISAVRASG